MPRSEAVALLCNEADVHILRPDAFPRFDCQCIRLVADTVMTFVARIVDYWSMACGLAAGLSPTRKTVMCRWRR